MKRFTAVDFETGNPQRVSACAIGYALVEDGDIVAAGHNLIKPVGGHAPFQTRIHGIAEERTKDLSEERYELYGALKDFCKDGMIDGNEQRILLGMMNVEIAKLDHTRNAH